MEIGQLETQKDELEAELKQVSLFLNSRLYVLCLCVCSVSAVQDA